ncbi:hypothetical protein ScalyP_jg11710 [Parmales sp. scaly parma]|nr:hypothetical protein ScalyP_jg11710 [Parmales sp. scaly parma]
MAKETPRSTGAFVYRGAGKRNHQHLTKAQKFCITEACFIQRCLATNNHIEAKCTVAIDFWKDCVERNQKRIDNIK